MQYHVNNTLGICQDFIHSIVFSSEVPFRRNPSITFPKKIREIHKRLKNELYNLNDAFPLLVNEDMRLCYMTNIFDSLFSGAERSRVQSIDEMITIRKKNLSVLPVILWDRPRCMKSRALPLLMRSMAK